MEKPFYGRTGALTGAHEGLPVKESRSSLRFSKWFPSLLTVPQRVLYSITNEDGIDHSIFSFLRVACVYEEIRKYASDCMHHGILLRNVLKWHKASVGNEGDCAADLAASGGAGGLFQPYIPTYDIRVLKEGKTVASYAAVSRRAVTLVGKDLHLNDIHTGFHPSCSAQHAALEVRFVYAHAEELGRQISVWVKEQNLDWKSTEDIEKVCTRVCEVMQKLGNGDNAWMIELQIMDLGSTNGTRLNGELLRAFDPTTLIEGDVLTFGFSTRCYVVTRP